MKVAQRLRAMGIRGKPIAPGSPWQNGFAERLIGSIQRECVDHVVVLGEAHLGYDFQKGQGMAALTSEVQDKKGQHFRLTFKTTGHIEPTWLDQTFVRRSSTPGLRS
jgi:transposase InsO family protein